MDLVQRIEFTSIMAIAQSVHHGVHLNLAGKLVENAFIELEHSHSSLCVRLCSREVFEVEFCDVTQLAAGTSFA